MPSSAPAAGSFTLGLASEEMENMMLADKTLDDMKRLPVPFQAPDDVLETFRNDTGRLQEVKS